MKARPTDSRLAVLLRAAVGMTDVTPLIPSQWWNIGGGVPVDAWQRNIKPESEDKLLATSAVYGCVSLIAADISKLRPKLVEEKEGVWLDTWSPAFSPVLRKPNSYQTMIQFISYWLVCKLLWGNVYVVKYRDARRVVNELHILDPRMVKVLVTHSEGSVYYEAQADHLAGIKGPVTLPATEVIHDRAICPFHPMIGVSPLYAAALSATQTRKIQNNSSVFFENMSRPSGQLTSPSEITDETAARLKRDFEEQFAGRNIGRVLVAGSGLKYDPMTMPAEQAQLIEQLDWTGKDVCVPFHVPPYKLGFGDPPTFNNIAQLAQEYYSTCLQEHIESIEKLLDEGLALPPNLGVMFDVEALLRLDPLTRADRAERLSKAGAMSPDEARREENKSPLPEGSGKVPFLQQQQYPITVLAKRTDVTPPAAPTSAPKPQEDDPAAKAIERLLGEHAAQEALARAAALDQVRTMVERVEGVYGLQTAAAADDGWQALALEALQLELDEG